MKKSLRRLDYDWFPKMFSFDHLWKAYRLCRKNVRWKATVQRYCAMASYWIQKTQKRLRDGTFKSPGFNEFYILERGKVRFIQAVTIFERVVQRCLCDYCLNKALMPSFIMDNWASQKGKGYHFAIRRLRKYLARFIRKHGLNGYILLFDFKDFFASIPHDLVKRIAAKYIADQEILRLLYHFIDCFGEIGLGLGSQISQILALAVGSLFDHALTETLQNDGYGRYMDDGFILSDSKETLKACAKKLQELSNRYGLRLNLKKTRIVKLSHGFKFLKKRFSFTETGKIIMKICRKSISRERQRLKKLVNKVRTGVLTVKDLYQSFQSWHGYASFGNAWHTAQNMKTYLISLLTA